MREIDKQGLVVIVVGDDEPGCKCHHPVDRLLHLRPSFAGNFRSARALEPRRAGFCGLLKGECRLFLKSGVASYSGNDSCNLRKGDRWTDRAFYLVGWHAPVAAAGVLSDAG